MGLFSPHKLNEATNLLQTKKRKEFETLLLQHLREERELLQDLREVSELAINYEHRIKSAANSKYWSADHESTNDKITLELVEAQKLEREILAKIDKLTKHVKNMG